MPRSGRRRNRKTGNGSRSQEVYAGLRVGSGIMELMFIMFTYGMLLFGVG